MADTIDLSTETIDPAAVKAVRPALLLECNAIPVRWVEERLLVAVANLDQPGLMEALALAGRPLIVVGAGEADILAAQERFGLRRPPVSPAPPPPPRGPGQRRAVRRGCVIGLLLTGVLALLVIIPIVWFVPPWLRRMNQERNAKCVAHLRDLGRALSAYVEDWDDRLPTAVDTETKWSAPSLGPGESWHCPAAAGRIVGRAYFYNLRDPYGIPLALTLPASWVAFAETDEEPDIDWRHNGWANFGFVDGHVKAYSRREPPAMVYPLQRRPATVRGRLKPSPAAPRPSSASSRPKPRPGARGARPPGRRG